MSAPTIQVVVFPRGQLNAEDRERLAKSGVLAVEADNPDAVRVLVPAAPMICADDLLLSALDGLADSYTPAGSHKAMVLSLRDRMIKRDRRASKADGRGA